MSDFGALWKYENKPACTESVRVFIIWISKPCKLCGKRRVRVYCQTDQCDNAITPDMSLCIQFAARKNFIHEWEASKSPNGRYDVTVPLPAEEPRLYAVLLEVHDHAGEHGNVAYARRFVLYDNSSTVDMSGTLTVESAAVE